MELIELITALIFGIVLKRIKNLIISILCLMNTFIVLKLFNPELILIPVSEWSLHSIFYGYNFWIIGTVIFLLSWYIIYWVLPYVIKTYFLNNQLQKFSNKYTQLSDAASKELESVLRVITRFVYSIVKFIPKSKKISPEPSIQDFTDIFLNTLILLIHAALVIPYFIDKTLTVAIVLGILFLYHIFVLPIIGMFYKPIEKIVDEL